MTKPDVIALQTSQMMAFCDLLGLPDSAQESTESMIVALEAADFSGLDIKDRPALATNKVSAKIIADRKTRLGRA